MKLLIMQGLSMAPWLMPGNVVLVDDSFPANHVCFGDVVVFRHRFSSAAMAHRVVNRGLRTKGDRNLEMDTPSPDWQYEGKIKEINRDGEWVKIRFGKLLGLISLSGFYPGQRLPHWMSRTRFTQFFKA